MTLPFKPRVAQTICRIDRKTQAVTAGVDFEDIPADIEGFGSEKLDYTFYVRLDSLGEIRMTCENLVAYSEDYMKGRTTSASASVTASQAYIKLCESQNATYTSMAEVKVTGYIGNKRHISVFQTYHDGATVVQQTSYYTADTSTEIDSFQFYSPVNDTLTYSIACEAVPKVQYNPHAIRLPRETWSAQSDTRNVSVFSGWDYDVYVDCHLDSAETDYIDVRANGVATATRTRQQMQNASGSISSANSTQSSDSRLHTGMCYLNKEIGRKQISVTSNNITASPQQTEQYTTETDTSTELTNIDLVPSGTVSGYCDFYLVPKGYNADLTPWTYRQVVNIAGDFSAGKSFEIPSDALLMKVDFVGDNTAGATTAFELDFNDLGVDIDAQYLYSSDSSTSAAFNSSRLTLFNTDDEGCAESIISLKSGANRPVLSKFSYAGSKIMLQASWIKNSSTVFTSAQIKASNTNTINGLLTVSFY